MLDIGLMRPSSSWMRSPTAPASVARVLGMRVDATSYQEAVGQIASWAELKESRYVCEVPVDMVVHTLDSSDCWKAIEGADLVTPGGMPIVWLLRLVAFPNQPRVYGPELMLRTCSMAASRGIPIGLFGSTSNVISRLAEELQRRFPGLEIPFVDASTFPPPNPDEDSELIEGITRSGCRILFVGLGCPRQELWMHAQRGRVPCIMLGVGAAFDFISGAKPQAPTWMQRAGLEWFFRLITEPRRLGPRYLCGNPRFAVLASLQLIRFWLKRENPCPTERHGADANC